MSSIDLIIPGREVSLGGISVKRVLPYAKRRMVGPFIFLDHMGPHVFAKGYGLSIAPHPHIGLSTLTYLLEGRALHRDSLGCEQIIRAEEVNWMTAGNGVAHAERSLEADLQDEQRLHGLQIWVALPIEQEDRDPSFTHIAAEDLPRLELGDVTCKLIAGSAHGKVSPVPVFSPLFLLDVPMSTGARFTFDPDGQDAAVYVAQGEIQFDEQKVGASQMAVLGRNAPVNFTATREARVFVFGGEAFPQEKHVWWNFVSSSREKIEDAKRRWEEDEFPPVVNESNFSRVPLPQG